MKNAVFIDDDETFLYLIQRFSNRGRIPNLGKLYTALNGQLALDFINARGDEELPDAMFVDINMPVMDGHEFLREFGELRKKRPKLMDVHPVAVITTSTSDKDKSKIEQVGFVEDYLVKDIDMTDLANKINELLA